MAKQLDVGSNKVGMKDAAKPLTKKQANARVRYLLDNADKIKYELRTYSGEQFNG